MRKALLAGSVSGVAQIVINTALVGILIPVFIGKLGLELYGVFSLISVVASLNVFVNFGFNTSLIKYIAEQGRIKESNYDIAVTFTVLLCVLVPVSLTVIAGRDFVLEHILQVPSLLIDDKVRRCFGYLVVSSVLVLLGQIPSAMLDAFQRIHITNSIQIGYNMLNRGCVLLSVIVAPRLDYVGLSVLGTTVVWWVVLVVAALHSWQFFDFRGCAENFIRIARKHLSYGSRIYTSSMLGFLFEPTSKLLISRYIGLNEVAFFEIGLRFKGLIWNMFERILYPFVPHVASIRDGLQARSLVADLQQKLAIIMIPMFITVGFVAYPLVDVWIRRDVILVANTTRVITMVYLIAVIFLPYYNYLMVKNQPGKAMIVQGSNVLVNVLLFLVLTPLFGYYGALAGFVASVLVSTIVCIRFQLKEHVDLPINATGAAGKIALLAGMLVALDGGLHTLSSNSVALLIAIPLANVLASVLVIRFTHLVNRNEIQRYFGSYGQLSATMGRILVRGT
jgi:O-antigen/teichoic acid export membrane protein